MKIKGIDIRKNLTKAEEIKILETLHEAFKGTGNYLEGLFTESMIAKCRTHIETAWTTFSRTSHEEACLACSEEYKKTDKLEKELHQVKASLYNTEVREARMSLIVETFQKAFKDLITL